MNMKSRRFVIKPNELCLNELFSQFKKGDVYDV